MERFLGRDFGDVRTHSGSAAAGMTMALGAEAFTVGRDVFFGRGREQFDTPSGMALLGHELTHVAQGRSFRRLGATGILQAQAEEREASRSELVLRQALGARREESPSAIGRSMGQAGLPLGEGVARERAPQVKAPSVETLPSLRSTVPSMELARAPLARATSEQSPSGDPTQAAADESQAPEEQRREVDVEALAQRVYDLIVRRLTVEREMIGYRW
jgi:hypothetical protein